ncbi:MAG: hypothetical protein ACI4S9_04555, partial [Christensenellales bacterium]
MRKRLRAIAALIVLVIVAGLFCSCNGGMTDNVSHYEAPVLSESVQASDKYYVSPLGSDSGAGTVESPFKTLQCAMLAVNKFKAVMNCDMSVLLMDGTTYLDETLELTYEDNLPGGHTLTIESYDGQATISGGRAIGNWVRTSLNGLTVYKALISDVESVRGFSVNGQRMEIASAYAERNALNKYNNLLGWNWGDDEQRSIKVTTSGVSFASVRNPSQLDVGMICEWKTFIIRVAEVIDDRTLGLLQPYASWFTTPASVGKLDPGGYWFPNPKHGIWLQNDVSLIDSEGEWCFDRKEKCIYYCPPDGRDPNGDVCVISNLDKIVTIYGGISEQNRQEPVRNIVFRNLGFENGGHTQLDTEGLGMVQGQSYYSGVT